MLRVYLPPISIQLKVCQASSTSSSVAHFSAGSLRPLYVVFSSPPPISLLKSPLAQAVVIMVEQLVPMLGLEALLHSLDPAPHSTFDKIMFLVDNAFTHGQRLTAAISFTSLVTLIIARALKKKIVATGARWTAWVFYIPEIFILVVVSTSWFPVLPFSQGKVA